MELSSRSGSKNHSMNKDIYSYSAEGDESSDLHEATFQDNPTWALTELLQSINSLQSKDPEEIIHEGNRLVSLLRSNEDLKKDIVLKSFIHKVQFMIVHRATEVRALFYRILRHAIYDYFSLKIFIQSRILIFVIVSLSSENSMMEKEEAIKLIREFLTIPQGTDNLSIGVIKSIVAIFEVEDIESKSSERFQLFCLETICEIAVLRPELVFHSGAFRTISFALIEKSSVESMTCLLVLVYILDLPESRKYLRNGADLKPLIGFFANLGAEQEDCNLFVPKIQNVAFIITALLKNWNGLMGFAHNNFESIKDLIRSLRIKNSVIRSILLDIFNDVLLLESLPWLDKSSIADIIRRYNSFNKYNSLGFSYASEEGTIVQGQVDHFLGLWIMILLNNGLVPTLNWIINEDYDDSNSEKAKSLLGHIYFMSHRLLPSEYLEDKFLLPITIDNKLQLRKFYDNAKDTSFSARKRTELKNSITALKIRSTYHIDEAELKNWINLSKVLAIKEYEDWNWDSLIKICQGPLMNPKHFNDILEKNPKFLKRLFSFYRPFKYRFCKISKSSNNKQNYIIVIVQLFESLMKTKNGLKYLSSNKLLPQLSEIFAQIDPYSGVTAKEPILSVAMLENTLSLGYVDLIVALFRSKEGIELLSQWQFINIIHNIILGSAYSDSNNLILMTLLGSLDYSSNDQTRIILAKSMEISNNNVKKYILEVVMPGVLKQPQCDDFCIKLFVTSCYDKNVAIRKSSVDLLAKFCIPEETKRIDCLVSFLPPVPIFQKYASGHTLLMCMLGSSKGFRYLEDLGFVDSEFEKWNNLTSFDYIEYIEEMMRRRFFPYIPRRKVDIDVYFNFFNYLLRTEEGIAYMQNSKQKIYLTKLFSSIILLAEEYNEIEEEVLVENRGISQRKSEVLYSLKQNLWIIGDIASSTQGIKLLDSLSASSLHMPIIKYTLNLFESSTCWQLRGVCFFQLGRISSTLEGVEILDELGWCSVLDGRKLPSGFCYPTSIANGDFAKVEVNNPYRDGNYYAIFGGDSEAIEGSNKLFEDLETDDIIDGSNIHERVLNLMKQLNSALSRYVRRAVKQLTLIKKKSPSVFDSLAFFLKVIRLIDSGNYKFHGRKFIIELFLDTRVFNELIESNRKSSMG